MGLSINTIITLDTNEKYIVLNETLYEGNKYFMVMGIDDKKQVIPEKAGIFKECVEGLDTYIVKVEEPELLANLTKVFKKQI